METGDLAHAGMDVVVAILMTHSVSPHARRLVEKLLIDDPYDINVKPDETASNRNVEILNAYLKTMGLRLVFRKKPKKRTQVVSIPVVSMIQKPMTKVVTMLDKNQNLDYLEELYKRQDELEEKQKNSVVTTKVVTMYKPYEYKEE